MVHEIESSAINLRPNEDILSYKNAGIFETFSLEQFPDNKLKISMSTKKFSNYLKAYFEFCGCIHVKEKINNIHHWRAQAII